MIRDCFESKEYGNSLWLNRIKKVWLKYQDGKTRPKRLNINSKGFILIVQEAETTYLEECSFSSNPFFL